MKKAIFFSLIAMISIFTFSCKKDPNSLHTVKYTIQGNSKSTVTYTDVTGNSQTVANAEPSWNTSFSSSSHGSIVKLTVTSLDASPIGGKIFIDDVQKAQSDGATGTLTISTVIP